MKGMEHETVPVKAFVVVVPIKELNFFKSLWTVVITDDGRMHGEKGI